MLTPETPPRNVYTTDNNISACSCCPASAAANTATVFTNTATNINTATAILNITAMAT